jgi:hypothetical protein
MRVRDRYRAVSARRIENSDLAGEKRGTPHVWSDEIACDWKADQHSGRRKSADCWHQDGALIERLVFQTGTNGGEVQR